MKTKKKIYQKPTEHDIHLKYLCKKCGNAHWLSYKEACTKNFKVVCDCGHIFKVKRVSGFKLKYSKIIATGKNNIQINQSISSEILDRATDILINYGFTKSESIELLKKAYSDIKTDDIKSLIKHALSIMKVSNE